MLTVLAGALACGGVSAAAQDVAGSQDHSLISRYPGSRIVFYNLKEYDEYTVPLGPAGPDWKLQKTERVEGKVTRIGYELPATRSVLEVYRNYEGALTAAGFAPLFQCRGQEGPDACGPLQGFLHPPTGWGGGTRTTSGTWSRSREGRGVALTWCST